MTHDDYFNHLRLNYRCYLFSIQLHKYIAIVAVDDANYKL